MAPMHCPACAAPIDVSTELPGSQVLCSCGIMVKVLAAPGEVDIEREKIKPGPCPRCSTQLVEAVTLGGLGAHACPECGGVFADRAAVAELSSGMNGPVSARDNRARKPTLTPDNLKCPVCGEGMRRVNFSYSAGVIVEVCSEHGTWFDALQIDRAAAFIAARGHEHGDEGPPEDGPPVSAEVDRNLGKLKAQMVGERYDEMARVERATWFTRFGLRLLFDWFL
ncbi:MAG: zf-TFIIB domain-containing protein [Byssovorax sp.]